jgi:hypothetical protein
MIPTFGFFDYVRESWKKESKTINYADVKEYTQIWEDFKN